MATKLTDTSSIEQIIKELSLEEKARLVTGGTPFRTEALPEHDIPAFLMLDSCNGFNSMEYGGEAGYEKAADKAAAAGAPIDRETLRDMGGLLIGFTQMQNEYAQKANSAEPPIPMEYGCYPTGIVNGSTWNLEAVEECGRALAMEMGSKGVDMILGPNINIQRDPKCGRLAESYSEDPCLVSKLAPAMVAGIQSEGLIACPKHFAANNQETDRMAVNAQVSERALHEIYLPGFRACVDAGCRAVMSAYNKVNGFSCSMNERLLTDILRDDWAFDGFVVSDWGGTYDQVAAIAAGNDLTMPGPRGIQCIVQAVADGRLPEEKLNACVRNVLRAVLYASERDKRSIKFDMQRTLEAAKRTVYEGTVLLQNDGALPIPMSADVAFYGKRSRAFTACSGGSADVATSMNSNLYNSAAELLGTDRVSFSSCTDRTRYWVVVVGADAKEGADRKHLDMDAEDRAALDAALKEANEHGGRTIVVFNTVGPINFTEYANKVSGALCCFLPGMQGGKAVADILFGRVNPSGKLPLTWPKHDYDCPAYKNYPGENKTVLYGEGIYVGYRWYDARRIAPLYPFGHGLSYTTFDLSCLTLPDEADIDRQPLTVAVKVKNTGSIAGSEVVQLYIHDVASKIDKPVKELKGFQKVFLLPGEEKTVGITLTKDDFSSYCPEQSRFVAEPGLFNILIGNSSANIMLKKRINICCKNPFGFTGKSGIGQIAADPNAVKLVNGAIKGDICELAGVAIAFAPDKPLDEIWEATSMGAHLSEQGLTKAEADALYQTVLSELAAI